VSSSTYRRSDLISEVGIDEQGRLYVVPSTHQFTMIYREAMEVHWDTKRNALYGPKPREWSYRDWFAQIIAAAHSQGVDLKLSNTTMWIAISEEDQREFSKAADKLNDLEGY
jgi:hypothetical protein